MILRILSPVIVYNYTSQIYYILIHTKKSKRLRYEKLQNRQIHSYKCKQISTKAKVLLANTDFKSIGVAIILPAFEMHPSSRETRPEDFEKAAPRIASLYCGTFDGLAQRMQISEEKRKHAEPAPRPPRPRWKSRRTNKISPLVCARPPRADEACPRTCTRCLFDRGRRAYSRSGPGCAGESRASAYRSRWTRRACG